MAQPVLSAFRSTTDITDDKRWLETGQEASHKVSAKSCNSSLICMCQRSKETPLYKIFVSSLFLFSFNSVYDNINALYTPEL